MSQPSRIWHHTRFVDPAKVPAQQGFQGALRRKAAGDFMPAPAAHGIRFTVKRRASEGRDFLQFFID
ncbi:hypothetical protein ACFOHY_21235 [Rhizobium rosettiformans]|uniref:hypothetical protein n=1 Tax=Rhizobium rosettiformans TaxID=1368430 RepID=UPI0036099651